MTKSSGTILDGASRPRRGEAHDGPSTPHETISAAILAAKARGEPALVAFLTAGFPSRDSFKQHLQAIAEAADVVEIGVPFTDPMADGVTIQRASHAALAQGVTLRWILAQLETMPRGKTPLLLMSYLNPLLALGPQALASSAARAGVAGFIVPDLPFDESAELRAAFQAHGLALVQMVTPVTRASRLEQICASSQGFVYAVTMTGTTGKNVAVPAEVTRYLDAVRSRSPVPVCAGFGIRGREQLELLRDHVDGVVIGSALVEVLEQGGDPARWLRDLRGR
ncbi:MAG: tryptophan synthase subunit alpha [Gammaproteobacteria bacterium]|nr:tryptophan synthase subunit alpha [Gammaproteobacteria bacterium]